MYWIRCFLTYARFTCYLPHICTICLQLLLYVIHLILCGILNCLQSCIYSLDLLLAILQCFVTAVKGFQYKERATYELRLYVDDGSLISEILIDHNVSNSSINKTYLSLTFVYAPMNCLFSFRLYRIE